MCGNVALEYVRQLANCRCADRLWGDSAVCDVGPENMDAMELDMRMRLAELQAKYREKQRELARLQRRGSSEWVNDDDEDYTLSLSLSLSLYPASPATGQSALHQVHHKLHLSEVSTESTVRFCLTKCTNQLYRFYSKHRPFWMSLPVRLQCNTR